MAEKRPGFRVRGSVQGAGFRWWAQCKAVELVLRGVIMNQGDGSVEVHVAGPPEVLAELERWLGMPPPDPACLVWSRPPPCFRFLQTTSPSRAESWTLGTT